MRKLDFYGMYFCLLLMISISCNSDKRSTSKSVVKNSELSKELINRANFVYDQLLDSCFANGIITYEPKIKTSKNFKISNNYLDADKICRNFMSLFNSQERFLDSHLKSADVFIYRYRLRLNTSENRNFELRIELNTKGDLADYGLHHWHSEFYENQQRIEWQNL